MERRDIGMRRLAGALARFVAAACAIGMLAAPAAAAPGEIATTATGVRVVAYKGRMVDEAGKPVSGIFPMTFKLYAGLRAKKPIWSESLWVAVDRGLYTLNLGEDKALPAKADLTKLVIAVDVRGVGEVAREPFVAAVSSSPLPPPPAAAPASAGTAKGSVRYADTAGYAVEADHAKSADRLGNLTWEDMQRRVVEELGAAAGSARSKVGATKRVGRSVGGPGGTDAFEDSCPRGFVMTGIRGMHGNVVDSLQIICSPIE